MSSCTWAALYWATTRCLEEWGLWSGSRCIITAEHYDPAWHRTRCAHVHHLNCHYGQSPAWVTSVQVIFTHDWAKHSPTAVDLRGIVLGHVAQTVKITGTHSDQDGRRDWAAAVATCTGITGSAQRGGSLVCLEVWVIHERWVTTITFVIKAKGIITIEIGIIIYKSDK